ncbi:MAG: hypothetical protein FWE16_01185 [Firmicutes bacterium]|nr:hypothetical protein [Bacillota bacterium]
MGRLPKDPYKYLVSGVSNKPRVDKCPEIKSFVNAMQEYEKMHNTGSFIHAKKEAEIGRTAHAAGTKLMSLNLSMIPEETRKLFEEEWFQHMIDDWYELTDVWDEDYQLDGRDFTIPTFTDFKVSLAELVEKHEEVKERLEQISFLIKQPISTLISFPQKFLPTEVQQMVLKFNTQRADLRGRLYTPEEIPVWAHQAFYAGTDLDKIHNMKELMDQHRVTVINTRERRESKKVIKKNNTQEACQ